MDSNLILLIVVTLLSLPGGLFVSYLMSEPRAKWLSLLGAIIGAAGAAAGIYYFITMSKPSLDSLSFGLGSFFACSVGAFTGALIVNFLVGLSSRPPETSSEF